MEYNIITNPENPLCGMSQEEVVEHMENESSDFCCVKDQTTEICIAAVK